MKPVSKLTMFAALLAALVGAGAAVGSTFGPDAPTVPVEHEHGGR